MNIAYEAINIIELSVNKEPIKELNQRIEIYQRIKN